MGPTTETSALNSESKEATKWQKLAPHTIFLGLPPALLLPHPLPDSPPPYFQNTLLSSCFMKMDIALPPTTGSTAMASLEPWHCFICSGGGLWLGRIRRTRKEPEGRTKGTIHCNCSEDSRNYASPTILYPE